MTALPRHGRPRVGLFLVCLALLAGCGGAGGAEQEAVDTTADQQAEGMPAEQGGGRGPEATDAWEEQVRGEEPEWVENVFPPPGSEAASVNEVQLTHTTVGQREGVRL